jgi:hypothetical protein
MITKTDFYILFHHLDSNPWEFPLARDKFEGTRDLFFERFREYDYKDVMKVFNEMINSQKKFPCANDVYRWLRVTEEPEARKKFPEASKEQKQRRKDFIHETGKIIFGGNDKVKLEECVERFRNKT